MGGDPPRKATRPVGPAARGDHNVRFGGWRGNQRYGIGGGSKWGMVVQGPAGKKTKVTLQIVRVRTSSRGLDTKKSNKTHPLS